MNDQELRALIAQKVEENKAKFQALYNTFSAMIDGVLADSKEIVDAVPDFKTFYEMIVEEIDKQTSTGLFDAVDSVIMNLAIAQIAKANGLEDKFQKLKDGISDNLEVLQ